MVKVQPSASDKNRLHLTTYSANGYGDEGGLHENAHVITGGSAVFAIDGKKPASTTEPEQEFAERIAELGNRWGDQGGIHWRRNVDRFERSEGITRFVRTWTTRSWKRNLFTDDVVTCTYDLQAQ